MELKMSSLLRLSLNKRSEQPGPRHMLSTISSHLVEVPQALDEVVACIRWALRADGLLTRENTLDLQKNNPVLKSKSLFYKRYELSLFICCFQIFSWGSVLELNLFNYAFNVEHSKNREGDEKQCCGAAPLLEVQRRKEMFFKYKTLIFCNFFLLQTSNKLIYYSNYHQNYELGSKYGFIFLEFLNFTLKIISIINT